MVVLDATAGNRIMWPNKNPPLTVFMDKETRLAISPDIFADFRFCPFRNNVFDCAIFDPPFYYTLNPENWIFYNPKRKLSKYSEKRKNPTHIPTHYGCYKNKRELLINITRGQQELARVAKRLCFRWADGKGRISLWRILSCFFSWKEIYRRKWSPRKMKLSDKLRFSKRIGYNYWITMIRSSDTKANENEKTMADR